MTLLTRRSFLSLLFLCIVASHVALCVPSREKRHLMPRQQEEDGSGSGGDAVTTGDYYYTQPSWEEGYGDDDDGTASDTGSASAATPTNDPGSSGTDGGGGGSMSPTPAASDDNNSGWYSPTASNTIDNGQQQQPTSTDAASPTNDQTASASDNNQPPSSSSESDQSIVPAAAAPSTSSDEQQQQQDTTTTDIPPTSTTDPAAATTTTMSNNDQATTSSNNDATTTTTTTSFSVTSSTATPSLVLGSHECASDTHAVNGECPSDYFCNAATHACVQLLANGDQCFEDFQCSSSFCVDGTCNDQPAKEGAQLSGGQIAGITIGSVAGAVVLIGAFMFCMKRRRRYGGGNNSSSRARKFEQIRAQDDAEADVNMVERGDGGVRDSKYNMLTSLMQRASGGQTMSYGNVGADAAPPAMVEQQQHQQQPYNTMMAVPTATTNNHRESKVQEPVMDQCAYEAQQYYGSLATDVEPSSPAPGANPQHKSWMTTGSAIDPHVVERPPTTLVRDSTLNNLHAPLFHVTGPADPNTVPAGGEAHVPTIPPPPSSSSTEGAELDAFQSRRSSWLLKEIAERWRQGSSSGARSSAIAAPHNGDPHSNTGAPLWDDGLSVPGKRSSSLSNASTSLHNPFRSSSLMSGSISDQSTITPEHRRTDSMISTLRMPPLVREPDAWTVEDSMSLTSDPTTTTTTTSSNPQHHPQHPPSSS
ncbi:hypothetical protein O0I10_012346 [Lichtheimia ornata]|uniref:Extracellular membrane protein CFEM domain-containing protein n=1 Tax=Lichtheimia ornata TaxID=688661 RepID=A0AAD7USV1_9FUNG|nr:uncharacterized protein O0I10_012346 [Lichtheimia ornata]KAJ8652037.1 hypothetical protein O0I10_012346 [Lichtheimia ornata]